jgi:hypothetical protein
MDEITFGFQKGSHWVTSLFFWWLKSAYFLWSLKEGFAIFLKIQECENIKWPSFSKWPHKRILNFYTK